MAAMRAIVEPNKGKLQGVAARVPFDAIMEHVSSPVGPADLNIANKDIWVLLLDAKRAFDRCRAAASVSRCGSHPTR